MNHPHSETEKKCKECGQDYSPDDYVSQKQYWDFPTDYQHGSKEYCLACWLGVGPNDVDGEQSTK